MSYLLSPVLYLEAKDFNSNLDLKHFKNKTCVVMVQANFCGHCTSAKPHFQKFAEKNKPNVVCLTIEGDDNTPETEKLLNLVKKLKPSFGGFPDYLLFKNNKFVQKEINGRTAEALEEFIK
jgi:thiol-disulfide isomerase/thioredoxin